MKVFRWRALPALFLILALLASCLSCAPDEGGEEGTLSFVDDQGREVILSSAPCRVAALLGSFAEVWELAGGRVVATASDAWSDYELNLEGAVDLGGAHSPSVERLLSAEPDFVIASASTAADLALAELLEPLGIPIAYFDVDCFADYLRMLRTCTALTGREDLFEQNGLAVERRINEVRAAYADRMAAGGETVLLLRASSGSVKAKGSEGTVLGEMLADLGCVNLADREGALLEELNVEYVIAHEPRHIFVVTMGQNTAAAEASLTKMMEENPAWGTLEAVREDRLHLMDRALFNRKPNARWALAYETLYQTLTGEAL